MTSSMLDQAARWFSAKKPQPMTPTLSADETKRPSSPRAAGAASGFRSGQGRSARYSGSRTLRGRRGVRRPCDILGRYRRQSPSRKFISEKLPERVVGDQFRLNRRPVRVPIVSRLYAARLATLAIIARLQPVLATSRVEGWTTTTGYRAPVDHSLRRERRHTTSL
jgi:hypothetical protein